ncbi:MAG: M14 family metallopeptidase [Draconibacterium sp.]|nr:M14 family metallopeptidase [Draconibacterium sp.]
MVKKLFNFLWLAVLLFSFGPLSAQISVSFDKYHTNKEVQQILKTLQQTNAANSKLHYIATSPGGAPITILEIGSNRKDAPAIFVGANFEGNVPISTEGALYLAKMLADSVDYTQNVKWYILPQPNPDAAKDFFATVKTGKPVNAYELNYDADNAVSEDGYDDLNGDGLITQIRIKDLEGTYKVSDNDARIMERADAKKGQKGSYIIMTEGLDNDSDGHYNEDVSGGINVGIAFPFLFPTEKVEAGVFPGQTPEVYGLLRFMYDHPEIAMVYTLGSSDFCIAPPKAGRKGGANLQSLKIPERYASMFGADPNKTYTMNEVIELLKPQVPQGMEVTPSLVAGFLGLGAAVNPQDADLAFYKKLSEDYKKYLEAQKVNTEVLASAPTKDGSFELWAYYHLGVPSFAMNLFTIPKVKEEKEKDSDAPKMEDVEKMSADEFVALGEDKIGAFLKANNAPDRFKAKGIIEMMGSGRFTPKQMVGMMKNMPKPKKEGELSEKDKALLAWSDKHWEGKGFVVWEKVDHPDFDEVEVGGYMPYLESTPKPELIDSLAKTKLPWFLKLSNKLPDIKIAGEKVTDLGAGIYRVEIFVENSGFLPYPTSMGQRNGQPAALVVVFDGDVEFLEGTARKPVGEIGGNTVKKLSWIIKTDKEPTISVKVESAVFTDDVKQIKIGG